MLLTYLMRAGVTQLQSRAGPHMEPPAPFPSAFLDLPPAQGANASSSQNDDLLVLPYIARILMEDEEEMVDELSYYQYADHPALLQAQQHYAHILSGSGASSLQLAAAGPCYSGDIDALGATVVLSTSTQSGNKEDIMSSFPNRFRPEAESSSSMDDLTSMAFFRGMEEGSKFLPTYSERANGAGRRKRFDGGDDEVEVAMGRGSKQAAAPPLPESSSEEAAAREMLDKLMLNGYDVCLADASAQDPRGVVMDTAKTPPPPPPRGTRPAVDLLTMLIRCAEAVSSNHRRGAADLLREIRRHSSPAGDGVQRLAHYFAGGLEARMAGTGIQLYRSLAAKGASTACVLKACQLFMAAGFFLPVEHLFSSAAIRDAVAGRKKLHVVHYGLGHGLQWPDLLRRLARREGGPPEVRLTGIDAPLPGFRPARLIEDTGRRLGECARQLGVPFRFRGIAARSDAVRAGDLDIDADEVLVVSCIYHFRTLMDESVVVDGPNPRDTALEAIREMRPSVFIHGVFNGAHCAAYFTTRFREALHQYAALFDMMDAVAPRGGDGRLEVEEGIFARCAVNVIACEGADRVERSEGYRQWEARSKRAGLRLLSLDPGIVRTITGKVKKETHKDFVIGEDGGWLLHGWKGRMLYALSAWTSAE